MSNALNTPVEALELAYPLRVEPYALRPGSGGAGLQRGGDGVVREIRALEDCRLSVLGDRRRHAPPGARGGEPGALGRTVVNGGEIPGKDTRWLVAGDVVRTETPGGGGFGARRGRQVAFPACAETSSNSTTSIHLRPMTRCMPPRCSSFARSAARRSRRRRTRRLRAGRARDRPHLAPPARRSRDDGTAA